MIDLSLLPDGGMGWLDASGPNAQIVLSTRIRLARNLVGHPFSLRASDADRAAGQPVLRPLCGIDRAGRGREDEEERIPLRVDLGPAVPVDRSAQQLPVPGEQLLAALAPERPQKPRRPLDVGEHEGDGARRKLGDRTHGDSNRRTVAGKGVGAGLGSPPRRIGHVERHCRRRHDRIEGGLVRFQRFSSGGSDDLQHWRALGEGQIARLSFNGERIDQRSVNLGGRQVRYLRLLWESPREAPLLSAVHVVSRRTTEQEAPVLWSDPLQAPRDKGGDYVLTLSVALKVEHLRVDLPQDNTLAPVAVAGRYTLDSGPQQQEPWMYLARAILYRLPADGAPGVNDRIDLPGKAVRQLRLRVDQRGGGLGAGAVTLRVGLRATEVIFLARGRAPYALAVGNAKGAAADLPLTTLIPGYDGRGADVGSAVLAGPPLTLAAKTPLATATVQSRAWKRVALWTVLLAGVALLAAMTWQLMRKPQE